jgi:hypothetical protein
MRVGSGRRLDRIPGGVREGGARPLRNQVFQNKAKIAWKGMVSALLEMVE